MVLGDDVNIDSLGLTAHLGGAITVITDDSPVTRGQGELNIKSGKYSAYGRQLDIERGRLFFNNGPINNPGIELRAQKEFPDVTAGVNVRGLLRSPQVTFFSDPELPQSQIASLILAGGTLETAQNSEKPGAARNDLLLQGSALIAQRFGSRVGFDDLGVESDINNDTSLVLGKYLLPRLYISYGISLAEAINTLKMRLTLGKGWTLKTEAGKARSADVVYTFRKGDAKSEEEEPPPQ
jgi:translocation and assembly module TamB